MSSCSCSAAPFPMCTGVDPPVAGPVVKHVLLQVGGAVDAVHDVQRTAVATDPFPDPISQPPPELPGLLGHAEPEQRMHREGGVADPGVAVVPVALAADLLGSAAVGAATRPPLGA